MFFEDLEVLFVFFEDLKELLFEVFFFSVNVFFNFVFFCMLLNLEVMIGSKGVIIIILNII